MPLSLSHLAMRIESTNSRAAADAILDRLDDLERWLAERDATIERLNAEIEELKEARDECGECARAAPAI